MLLYWPLEGDVLTTKHPLGGLVRAVLLFRGLAVVVARAWSPATKMLGLKSMLIRIKILGFVQIVLSESQCYGALDPSCHVNQRLCKIFIRYCHASFQHCKSSKWPNYIPAWAWLMCFRLWPLLASQVTNPNPHALGEPTNVEAP